jgi:hypothetical protein
MCPVVDLNASHDGQHESTRPTKYDFLKYISVVLRLADLWQILSAALTADVTPNIGP